MNVYLTKGTATHNAGESLHLHEADAQALLDAGHAALPGTPEAQAAAQAREARQGEKPSPTIRSNASRAAVDAWLKKG
jgi:hypothetical protein